MKKEAKEKIRILFVCLGNICRSPAAEGTFRKIVQEKGLSDRIEADSCGTGSWHVGELPHHLTRKVAQEKGIQLTHRARQFRGEIEYREFDYLVAMDRTNYQDILESLPSAEDKSKVFLFRDFEKKPYRNSHGLGNSVPDPYYGGIDGFYQVQEIVTKCSYGLLDYIKEAHHVE